MSPKIQAQAAKFWQAVVSVETINAYKKALDVTWTIIKEAAVLLWLVVCLVLVIFDWGYDVATNAGRKTRTWWDGLSKVDSNEIATETGKQLMAVSKASLYSTISQARSQLGLPTKPEPTEPSPAKDSGKDSAVSTPPAVTTPTATTPIATTSTATASSSSSVSE